MSSPIIHCSVSLPSFAELPLSISVPSDPRDPFSVPNSHIWKITQGRRKKGKNVRGQAGQEDCYRQATTISMLPDDVLLEIFDSHRTILEYLFPLVWEWSFLVHVCRRWRQIVFASPHRLNLRILCTSRTPVRENLGIWPALPIFIDYHHYDRRWHRDNASSNVITALEHLDRVRDVRFSVTSSELEKIATVMQEPFPVLTSLHIKSEDGDAPILPGEFLGGSAPCLQDIYLNGIPFPTLPTLLLSASSLIELNLRNIPPTGYISPEEMVVGLVALPRLKTLIIKFRSANPHPDRIHLPPVTRTILPALTAFIFQGASEYLEDLVARINCPQLNRIYIDYLNQLVDFQVAQLDKFIDRSIGPKLTLFRQARVAIDSDRVIFNTSHVADDPYPLPPSPWTSTSILCEGIDWQVSHITQVLSQFSATLSNVVHLTLYAPNRTEVHQLDCTDVEWALLLHQFSTAQTLHVSRSLAGHFALALAGIMEVAEVLPSLDLIYLEGQQASTVEKFVAARRLSDHPVAVVDTEWEFYKRVESYVIE